MLSPAAIYNDEYPSSGGQKSGVSPMLFASSSPRSNLESSIAGLSRKAKEATIIRTTANALRLTGNDAAVIITRIDVVTVSNPIRSNRGPTFKKTAVVTAMATKMNALAVSESCNLSAW